MCTPNEAYHGYCYCSKTSHQPHIPADIQDLVVRLALANRTCLVGGILKSLAEAFKLTGSPASTPLVVCTATLQLDVERANLSEEYAAVVQGRVLDQ